MSLSRYIRRLREQEVESLQAAYADRIAAVFALGNEDIRFRYRIVGHGDDRLIRYRRSFVIQRVVCRDAFGIERVFRGCHAADERLDVKCAVSARKRSVHTAVVAYDHRLALNAAVYPQRVSAVKRLACERVCGYVYRTRFYPVIRRL